MRLAEDQIDIGRPVGEVFAFVSDVRNDVRWHTTVVQMRLASHEPIGLGTRFEGTYDSHKHTLETPPDPANFQPLEVTLIGFERDRTLRGHVQFLGKPRGIGARVLGRSFDLTFRFEATSAGTRVFRGGEVHPVALVRPLLPLFARANANRGAYLLGNLKRALEEPG